MEYLLTWLVCFVVFLTIDMVWLGVIAKTFYRNQIGHLLADDFRRTAALLFYVFYVAGIVWFCVLRADDWKTAAIGGALFGFFCYATYDMTNYATLRGWPLPMVLVDVAWGTVLTATVSGAGAYLSPMVIGSGA